jgi:hypothetical protein
VLGVVALELAMELGVVELEPVVGLILDVVELVLELVLE